MNDKVKLAGYTFLNARIASIILPFGVVAYLFGVPEWMAWAGGGLLVLAVAGEAFTAYAHGSAALLTEKMQADQEQLWLDQMTSQAEHWANGGWLDGSEEADEEGPDEEGGRTVPRV